MQTPSQGAHRGVQTQLHGNWPLLAPPQNRHCLLKVVKYQSRYQVQNRDSQQLVDKGLLVHHVGHIRHVESVKLWAVPKHDVANLTY